MKEKNFYDEKGNWDFSKFKIKTEKYSDWNYYEKIRQNTDENSLCLDLGTGGGENVLRKYPEVGMVIGTDFSKEMIKTARKNLKAYPQKRVKFVEMDSKKMTFPAELFDLVSARHTVINAKQIYEALKKGGVLIIEGVDQKDAWEIKEIFGRGQAYKDEISISEIDLKDLKKAGFSILEKVQILEDEYYETEEELYNLLLKVPILKDFSELHGREMSENQIIEKDLFEKYVSKFKTPKGILLKRVSYGIIARKD